MSGKSKPKKTCGLRTPTQNTALAIKSNKLVTKKLCKNKQQKITKVQLKDLGELHRSGNPGWSAGGTEK